MQRENIRAAVRERYGEIAERASSCCSTASSCCESQTEKSAIGLTGCCKPRCTLYAP